MRYLSAHLVGAGDTELVGLYGLERLVPGSPDVQTLPEAEVWRESVGSVATQAERRVEADPSQFAGVGVERKGLTVTLHYRRAPSEAGWVQSFAAEQADASGLVAHPGKMSVELRPPVATDKGSVVTGLSRGLSAVCYLGDDIGDLPAFEALKALRDQGVFTVAVAVRSGVGDETPARVVDAADLVVDGPNGVLGILRELAG